MSKKPIKENGTTVAEQQRKEIDSSTDRDEWSKTSSFPVVGIGASAGGLEALKVLLENLTIDTGMAFVIIQHLKKISRKI